MGRGLGRFDLGVARHSLLPELEAEILAIIGRELSEESLAFFNALFRELLKHGSVSLIHSKQEQIPQMREPAYNLGFFIREGVVQHPHPATVAAAQTQILHRLKVSRLRVLQLMKVFMHERE